MDPISGHTSSSAAISHQPSPFAVAGVRRKGSDRSTATSASGSTFSSMSSDSSELPSPTEEEQSHHARRPRIPSRPPSSSREREPSAGSPLSSETGSSPGTSPTTAGRRGVVMDETWDITPFKAPLSRDEGGFPFEFGTDTAMQLVLPVVVDEEEDDGQGDTTATTRESGSPPAAGAAGCPALAAASFSSPVAIRSRRRTTSSTTVRREQARLATAALAGHRTSVDDRTRSSSAQQPAVSSAATALPPLLAGVSTATEKSGPSLFSQEPLMTSPVEMEESSSTSSLPHLHLLPRPLLTPAQRKYSSSLILETQRLLSLSLSPHSTPTDEHPPPQPVIEEHNGFDLHPQLQESNAYHNPEGSPSSYERRYAALRREAEARAEALRAVRNEQQHRQGSQLAAYGAFGIALGSGATRAQREEAERRRGESVIYSSDEDEDEDEDEDDYDSGSDDESADDQYHHSGPPSSCWVGERPSRQRTRRDWLQDDAQLQWWDAERRDSIIDDSDDDDDGHVEFSSSWQRSRMRLAAANARVVDSARDERFS